MIEQVFVTSRFLLILLSNDYQSEIILWGSLILRFLICPVIDERHLGLGSIVPEEGLHVGCDGERKVLRKVLVIAWRSTIQHFWKAMLATPFLDYFLDQSLTVTSLELHHIAMRFVPSRCCGLGLPIKVPIVLVIIIAHICSCSSLYLSKLTVTPSHGTAYPEVASHGRSKSPSDHTAISSFKA